MDATTRLIGTILSELPEITCKTDEPLRNHTSFKTGGPVSAMFFPKSAAELAGLCDVLHRNDVTPVIVGNGTNLLVDDNALDIIVIKTTGNCNIEHTGETEITAGSGTAMSKLALYACELGLSGLEFAHGIPGTLGGAVTMNAGAYGGDTESVIRSTTAYGNDTGIFEITGADHRFSYRHSRFSDADDVIITSTISLVPGHKAAISEKMDDYYARRRESQPLDLPSAGSTFKRPKEGYTAALIEQAGLKGYTVGGAQVSVKHSGFIVNIGGASFPDVMAVIEHVQDTILRQFGIGLELEIKVIK